MVETGLLLQHSDIFPVHGVVVVPCMLGQCRVWHSVLTPHLSGAPSLVYRGICLSGPHKWQRKQHMGSGTQPLLALL